MTVSATPTRVNQDGNGVTITVPISFPFQATSHLKVIQTVIATGVQTVLVDPTNYGASGTQNALGHYPNGGTVTLVVAPASTIRTTVYLDPPQTQDLDLTENNSLPAEQVEAAIDYQTMLIKRIADLVVRTMRQPDGDETTISSMPSKVDRASKFAAWDSNGNPIAAAGTSANLTPVSSFVNTVLDDVDAASFRATIGFPTIASKGDLIAGTGAGTLGLRAAGANGDILLQDSNQASGWTVQPLRPASLVPNPFFAVDQLVNASTVVADDAYGHDHWYALTQTASIQVSTVTLQENGLPTAVRLRQHQAAAQRMGYACIIEADVAQGLRGKSLTFGFRFNVSASMNMRLAVLEWTGTADAVTSDIVNDWTSADYTDGAAKFFVDANLTPLTSSVKATAGGAFVDATTAEFTVGATCNNLVVFLWTGDTATQNFDLIASEIKLCHGHYTGRIQIPTFHETMAYANRFFQKSFEYAVVPVQNSGLTNGVYAFPATKAAALQNNGMTLNRRVMMRATPSLTTYSPGAATAEAFDLTASVACTTTGTWVNDPSTMILRTVGNAATGIGNLLAVHWTASARL